MPAPAAESSDSRDAAKVVGKPTHRGEHGEIHISGDGKRYKCSSYTRGDSDVDTWYQIDESGVRMLSSSARPPHVSARRWAKLTEDERLAEYVKYHDKVAEHQEVAEGSGTNAAAVAAKTLNNGDVIKFPKSTGNALLRWLRWGSWPVQSRRSVKGEGFCLGATFNGEFP